jgi:hypothetical protein
MLTCGMRDVASMRHDLCVLFRLPRSQPNVYMYNLHANTCFFFLGVALLIASRSASCTALHRDGASIWVSTANGPSGLSW